MRKKTTGDIMATVIEEWKARAEKAEAEARTWKERAEEAEARAEAEFHRANTNEENLIVALEEIERLRGAVLQHRTRVNTALDNDFPKYEVEAADHELWRAALDPPGGDKEEA